jgi:hypothetical protein
MIMACLNFRLCITKRKPQTARRGTIAVEKSAFDQYFRFQVISRLSKVYDYYFEVLITMLFIISKVRSHLFSLIVLLQMKKMKIKFWNNKMTINSLEVFEKQDKQISEMEKLQSREKKEEVLDSKISKK